MDPAINLDLCAKEPISFPGRIQPHGLLFVLDSEYRIIQVSENLTSFIGLACQDILLRPIIELLTNSDLFLSNISSVADSGRCNPFPSTFKDISQSFDTTIHFIKYQNIFVCEFEPQVLSNSQPLFGSGLPVISALLSSHDSLFEHMNRLSEKFLVAGDVLSIAKCAAEEVQRISNFDRIMCYQFDQEWNGQVIVELVRKPDIEIKYLGLCFPASDIPVQARELYVRNPFRLIANARYEPCAIVGHPLPDNQPVDLSQSALRSVSPVHIQYMKNMGTTASMSISLIVEGKLWGLIMGHNSTPAFVPCRTRILCELMGKLTSLQITNHKSKSEAEKHFKVQHMLSRVSEAARLPFSNVPSSPSAASVRERAERHANHLSNWLAYTVVPEAMTSLDSSFALLTHNGRVIPHGIPCEELQIVQTIETKISEFVAVRGDPGRNGVFAQDSLPPELVSSLASSGTADYCGFIRVHLGDTSAITFFRKEVWTEVTWAGAPKKLVVQKQDDPLQPVQLLPRLSFEKWLESVKCKSRPWSLVEIEAAQSLQRICVLELQAYEKERLLIEKEIAQTANALKSKLLANVSHEVRTPIHGIIGLINITLDSTLTDEQKENLVASRGAANSLLNIVDEILDISRIEAGKLELRHDPFQLREMLQEAIEIVDVSCKQKELELRLDIDYAIPDCLIGDRTRIRQVILNFLSNSLKFTDRGFIRLGARLVSIVDGGATAVICFSVTDTGIGIPEHMHTKIFDEFEQVDGELTRKQQGVGLGLAICYKIVCTMLGRV